MNHDRLYEIVATIECKIAGSILQSCKNEHGRKGGVAFQLQRRHALSKYGKSFQALVTCLRQLVLLFHVSVPVFNFLPSV